MAVKPEAGVSVHVRSLDAINAFRSAFTLHAAKTKPLVEDAWDEVSRTREWVRTDRRMHWENEVRRRRRKLEDAQQALFTARFSSLKAATAAQAAELHRARRALTEAEGKLEKVRAWTQQFDDRAGPLLKQLEELRNALTVEFAKGAAYLSNVIRALEAYAESYSNTVRAPDVPVVAEEFTKPGKDVSSGEQPGSGTKAKEAGNER
jgi:hypothetical protein